MSSVLFTEGVGRSVVLLLLCVGLSLGSVAPAHAKGQGPIAVWPASERYVLVADKSIPGMVTVDLATGEAVERLVIKHMAPKGVTSCADCDFAFISGSSGDFRLLRFKGKVADMIRDNGRLGLADATLEKLELATDKGKLTDGRMVVLTPDGKHAYVASSEDQAVYRVDFGATPNAVAITTHEKAEPFGLNWDSNGDLLVSMHKRYVWRMTVAGQVKDVYDIKEAKCPGVFKLKPNLRAAVDDPFRDNSVLILASNPKSYDAVLWRLSVDKWGRQRCVNAAGMIGRDPGWVDATGEDIFFSRPHYFTLRPGAQPPQAIITDIDNRSLRLVDLDTYRSTSVMYNRDQRMLELSPDQRTSRKSCAAQDWPGASSATGAQGKPSCIRPPKPEAMDLGFEQAKAYCAAQGARLCEPAELRGAGLAAGLKAWTNAECASCWLRRAGGKCASEIITYKTPGIVHGNKAFKQSWHSGQALELIAPAGGEPETLCLPVEKDSRAAAPCCADETVVSDAPAP